MGLQDRFIVGCLSGNFDLYYNIEKNCCIVTQGAGQVDNTVFETYDLAEGYT